MEINSLYASVLPTFFCCLLCGISTTCPIRKNGKWFLSENWTFKLVHIFWIYIITFFMITSLVLYESSESYYEGLAGFVVKISKWTLIGQIFLNLSNTPETSKKYKSILEDISFVDDMLKKSDVKLDHRKHFMAELSGVTLGFLYVMLILYGSLTTGNLEKMSTLPTTSFAIFYATYMLIVFGLRFCMMMTHLLTRYWVVNKELSSFSLPAIQKFPKMIAAKLETFLEVHYYLINAGVKLKSINQMRFLALFAGLFVVNICTLFNAYYEYYVKENIYSAFNWFQWTALVWVGFAECCFTCHLTVNEAKKTGVILHKFLLEDLNPLLTKKMLLFSNQVLNANIEFNACGFFPIDGTLFYMVVGATFNYMIIMLQFEEGNDETC